MPTARLSAAPAAAPPSRRALLRGALGLGALAALGLPALAPAPAWAADPGASAALEQALARPLRRLAGRGPRRAAASVLVASPSRGLRARVRLDPSAPDTFHAASVGKLFTAALVGRALDAGALRLDDKVADLLPAPVLAGLFVVDGVDHSGQVTIHHLLSHTSGVADYFADPAGPAGGAAARAVAAPQRAWTPEDLLQLTRAEQRAVAPPGATFHYSDTGYLLLGRVLEQVHEAPFVSQVHDGIFGPLGMGRSFYPGRSAPAAGGQALRPAYVRRVDLSAAPAITVDEAGGGAATTEDDLLTFLDALFAGGLLRPETLAALGAPQHRFVRGLWCGAGLMRWRLGELSPALRRLPELEGHMGVLGVQAFRTRGDDVSVVVSMGSDDANPASARLMIAGLMGALRVG